MENEIQEHGTHAHPAHQLDERFFQHANLPQNQGRLETASGEARGVGSCGDAIEVFLMIENNRIKAIRAQPAGCVYTVACASAMSKLADGQDLERALRIAPEHVAAELGGLPEDHLHCAALAVNTLGEAIDDYLQKVWGRGRHTG